ncbi:MipA/OmpV family protein [Teichococcus vastitatis]|uniref:MipA/OmpV family protein n=1 Tax=Teichococcus vastitatis TaxID=2307076 RepID=A0ABS9W403_9PROT|nr:MipA/OmpV family protein [Pseudoroseomonas vastitatis]MCI0754012.1 MipA/OmpV family protein [Pseudoroseomonas vastitatis]
MRWLALPLLLLAAPALAQTGTAPLATAGQPRIEAGLGAGGGWLPDYPAAEQNHLQGLAFPYLIYRGEILRSDDQGVRGRFYNSDAIGLDLSFSGAFPSSSDDNRAREGMADLDWQGEVGPALRLTLWRDPATRQRLNLELPVRAVFSSDLTSVSYRGLTASPELAYERLDLFRPGGRFRIGAGPLFATGRLMDYFYRVGPEDVRPGRPEYDAEAGYLGTRVQFSYRMPLTERLSLVAGGRVEAFHGATNEASPLFRDKWNTSVALGFAWSFFQSQARVSSTASPFD